MPSTPRITTLAWLVYVPLGLAGMAWAWFSDDRAAWALADPWMNAGAEARSATSLGLGAALGVLVVASTPSLVARVAWARALQRELKPMVANLSHRDIFWLALASGTAEELFFRGAMQPALGLWATSLIFGAVHVGPRGVFLAWALWASIMGLALGAIFELTGALSGCVVAHVWINLRNLRFAQRY
ncbi:MAG: CPBP family intramembrane glutamic endopeptidase [Polyangiales bacterium]